MRSILYEAPSVTKAIEKAWLASGKPVEFTICIYETEKKSFLGFVKKNAIVSIVFDPKKVEKKIKKERQIIAQVPSVNKVIPKSIVKHYVEPEDDSDDQDEYPNQPANGGWNNDLWSPELVNDVATSLRELIDIIGISTKFSVKVDRLVLKIDFDKPIIDAPSEERMLFASFAYLLMQFLKRKHKRGFKGCRISISSIRR